MNITVENPNLANLSPTDVSRQPDGFAEATAETSEQANFDSAELPQAEAIVPTSEKRPSRARNIAGMVLAAVPFGASLAIEIGGRSQGPSGDARRNASMAGTSSQDVW